LFAAILVSYFSIKIYIDSQNIFYCTLLHSLINFSGMFVFLGFWSFISYKLIFVLSIISLLPVIILKFRKKMVNINFSI
jgi:hypothetical protein